MSGKISKPLISAMEEDDSLHMEKVAIVGIGCRYGRGVNDVSKFWEMLIKGLDCTTPSPPDRFDASYFLSPGEKTPGKMYIQNGGYIDQDPYMFDRQFFKMPPDEAAHLDPQVRLLLEVTWEALENAGMPPSSIRGSQTGVYMGVTAQEYTLFACKPFHNMNQYSNSGTNSCMVANRISYEFDLRGPSFSVDTACSSSLYSIHLACEALKQKSCSMAVAGGVNLILTPSCTIGFCQAGMLAGDGKCKSFDQAADGYSRSEGAGVLVLKPLKEALRSRDRIYAVLRGGALSNDGRTPGIANPSYDAQISLVKTACQNAGVHPHQIVYAEAHGTGTRVGDTTEAGALGEVLGKQRGSSDPPLYIGSVKSNLGHSEGAAGVAGVIKVALCLYRKKIPPVVHFKAPNKNVNFEDLQIHVPTKLTQWPDSSKKKVACCSSFGFGGANANVILEGPPIKMVNGNATAKATDSLISCLLLSAASPAALHQRIKDWAEFLAVVPLTDIQFNSLLYMSTSRLEQHPYRIGFPVYSREDAFHQLQLKLNNDSTARCVEGVAPSASGSSRPIVFVFSGMGTQWWGMARELMDTEPVFMSKMKNIDTVLQNCGAKWSLVRMLSEEKDRDKINQTEISQPCLCAVAIGLVDLWKARGVVPDAVVGHSVGEVAAAHAAGLLSLEQAVKLIYRRGRELRKTSGSGKMVAVLHNVEAAIQLARDSQHGQLLDVAAVNSPSQIVFSGNGAEVDGFVNELKTEEIKCVVLKVNNAFHSKQQDVVKKPFLKKVGKFLKSEVTPERSTAIPMMSTVTGRYLTAEEANSPEYWFQNIRQKVSFMKALKNLAMDGNRVFVEVGPHSSLLPALNDTFAEFQSSDGSFLSTASLLRPRDTNTTAKDQENLLMCQIKLHVNGIATDFDIFSSFTGRHVVSTPSYPWQRERCSNVTLDARENFLFPAEKGQHPLLGKQRESFYLSESPVKIWRSDLDASTVPWVKDHVLQGAVVVPAAAYTETALAAAASINGNQYPLTLTGLTFDRFMFAPNAEGCLESTVEEKTPEQSLFTLRSHDESRGKWTQHCHANIISACEVGPAECGPSKQTADIESIKQRCVHTKSREEFFRLAEEAGFQLGPTFRGVQSCLISDDFRESLLCSEAPLSVQRDFQRYLYHPAYMDSVLQTYAVLLFGASEPGKNVHRVYRVPKSIKRFTLFSPTPSRIFIHSRATNSYCDIDVVDAETNIIFCSVRGLVFESFQDDKVEPEIWSTSWDKVSSLEVEEKPDNYSVPAQRLVIYPDKTEASSLLAHSLMTNASVPTSVLDVSGESDVVHDVVDLFSDDQERDTTLVLMQVGLPPTLNHGSVMSRYDFEEFQKRGPISFYSLCKALQSEGLKAKLLLVSRGAHHAKEGDMVDPFAASQATFGMTLTHEEPSIRFFNVDLPTTASSLECAEIALRMITNDYFWHNENVLAVRQLSTVGTDGQKWEVLSPRLMVAGVSKAPGFVPRSDWSVQRVSGSNRVLIKKMPEEKSSGPTAETIRVKVEAFHIWKQLESDGDDVLPVCVYAGCTKPERGSDREMRKLGLGTSTEVLKYMSSTSTDLIDVPQCLTSAEAVSIVTDYFPSAVFFGQALPVSGGMRLLFKLDSLDRANLSTVHYASKLGAETILLKEGHEDEGVEQLQIGCSYLTEVAEGSVDVLFLSVKSSVLNRTLHSVLPKMRRNGFVVIMQRQQQETRLHTLPPRMKTLIFDDHFTSIIKGLAPSEVPNILSNLLKMFNSKCTGRQLTCPPENNKGLSALATPNVEIFEGEVTEVDTEELLLPISLEEDDFVADKNAAYFITGGSTGFGLRLLEWLVSRGALYIYTGSRRGVNDELKTVIQKAAKVGAQVEHIRMDMSNAADVERGLEKMSKCQQGWPPLKVIFHCAASFSDALLQDMTADSWNGVMAPKAYGGLLLHQLTLKLGIHLDHFVLISSIVSLMGNSGQGGYCAANVFLNALAQYRHTLGLPAKALQMGVIKDVGFAERRGLVSKFEKRGMGSIGPEEALCFIGSALSVRQPLLGITGPFNTKIYAEKHRRLFTEHFREKYGRISLMKGIFYDRDVFQSSTSDSLIQSIIKLPFPKAREIIAKTLTELLSQQLGISDEVRHDASPMSLGLDSLMASELSQLINQTFEVTVGAVDLLNDKNSIQELSKKITSSMLAKVDSAPTSRSEGRDGGTSKQSQVVIEGESPKSVGVRMVCFPSNGAGPSLFAPWIQPLLQYGIQLLMVQLPGWEGREDEPPLTKMEDIARLIHEEIVTRVSDRPFVFFAHSMGSLIAFEVAHLLMAENDMCPRHLFVSAWYPPSNPYPHPEELQVGTATFARLKKTLVRQPKLFANVVREENVRFTFLDDSALSNVALMRRLIPCIEAAVEILKAYKYTPRKPLPCDITAFGGRQDEFVPPDLLKGWEVQKSRKHNFKKVTFPGRHMFLLTNTSEVVKLVVVSCMSDSARK